MHRRLLLPCHLSLFFSFIYCSNNIFLSCTDAVAQDAHKAITLDSQHQLTLLCLKEPLSKMSDSASQALFFCLTHGRHLTGHHVTLCLVQICLCSFAEWSVGGATVLFLVVFKESIKMPIPINLSYRDT